MKVKEWQWLVMFFLWLVALVSTLGSLYFSEVSGFVPCLLCWYQRIAMYPLSVIFLIALYSFDQSVVRFTLPVALIGWGIALYHNLIYFNVISESLSPCQQGISCKTTYITWLGFLTIPMLSFISFSILLVLLVILMKLNKKSLLNIEDEG